MLNSTKDNVEELVAALDIGFEITWESSPQRHGGLFANSITAPNLISDTRAQLKDVLLKVSLCPLCLCGEKNPWN